MKHKPYPNTPPSIPPPPHQTNSITDAELALLPRLELVLEGDVVLTLDPPDYLHDEVRRRDWLDTRIDRTTTARQTTTWPRRRLTYSCPERRACNTTLKAVALIYKS